MFTTLINKIYTGFVALSLFFLSSYTGNDAKIDHLEVLLNDDMVIFSGVLVDAFTNDFEEFFLSGLEIEIVFEVKVSSNKRFITQKKFSQSVIWDTVNRHWLIWSDDHNFEYETEDYFEMLDKLSHFTTFVYFNNHQQDIFDFSITAQLEKLYLPSQEKYLNLMLLWNRKVPEGRISVNSKEIK